ncbi:hypothetical protein AQUCO_01200272v1 [Aquilegia coerulea]|uniref:F-box domain-containing protein n=1 Tax=Aquilegia coerulea TaxID=218851 RepID=A0A2G5E536_AQUCA|nr:hypothetical protein AQUCO_01200272v1 [Aquilegia coerulea]
MEKRRRVEKKKRCWEDLDSDVLLIIYQKLSIKDLLFGAPLCCSSWYTISKEPSLWREVDLLHEFNDVNEFNSRQLAELVVARSQGCITSIKFPLTASIDDLLLVALRCPGIKYFNLRLPSKKLLKKKSIYLAITKLIELESMDVGDCFFSDEWVLQLINQCCPKFSKLKVYGISWNTVYLIVTHMPKINGLDLVQNWMLNET